MCYYYYYSLLLLLLLLPLRLMRLRASLRVRKKLADQAAEGCRLDAHSHKAGRP